MQLQNDPNYGQNSGEKEIYVTDINQWVELVYNFSTTTATNHNRVQLYLIELMAVQVLAMYIILMIFTKAIHPLVQVQL